MTFFYLISIILGVTFQNVIKKPYVQRTDGKGSYFFSLLVSLSAMLFFVFTTKEFKWDGGVIIYSVLFAIAYIIGTVFALGLYALCGEKC